MFCDESRDQTILGSLSSSRALDCAQDTLIIIHFCQLRPDNELFFGFVVDQCVMVSPGLTYNFLLYESIPAETMVDGLPRAQISCTRGTEHIYTFEAL